MYRRIGVFKEGSGVMEYSSNAVLEYCGIAMIE